jgi:hypothetical protein
MLRLDGAFRRRGRINLSINIDILSINIDITFTKKNRISKKKIINMRSVAVSSPKPGDARGFKLCPRPTVRAVVFMRGKVVTGCGLIFIIDRGDANVPTPTASPVPNIQGIQNWHGRTGSAGVFRM